VLWQAPEQEHGHFCLTVSPDGRYLAVGNWDKTIRVYDTSNGSMIVQLVGHRDHVNALAFTPDGKRLASASSDTSVLIWDTNRWSKDK
jgi:WD40 repeat protein